MMDTILILLGVVITTAIGENAVLARAFGLGELDYEEYTLPKALHNGLAVTVLSVLASFCGWGGEQLIDNFFPMPNHLRPPVFLAVYTLFFLLIVLTSLGIRRYRKLETRKRRYKLHTAIAYGYLPIGTLLVVGFGSYSLAESLCYGLGAGLGYFLATFLLYSIRERLEFCDFPKAFRGVPAVLVCFGLLSLALFGLVGHQLAL